MGPFVLATQPVRRHPAPNATASVAGPAPIPAVLRILGLARHGDSFPDQVRGVLQATLLTRYASADEVAALFSMHSRTLNRRLREYGTSFRELVDASRYEIAQQMLEGTALDVGKIATALGYADASAFTRAFRRWSGTTPAAWRAQRRHGSVVDGDRLSKPVHPVLDSARAARTLGSTK
jgi:AraC-like DNA-binding protein